MRHACSSSAQAAACTPASDFAPAATRSSIASSACARVRLALGRGLDLHEAAVAGDHGVEVHLGGRVLLVVQVEAQLAVHHPGGDGGDGVEQRQLVQAEQVLDLERDLVHGDVRAGDARRARAAVGLQHVAVHGDGALADDAEVHDAAQAAADEALDLHGAAALLAAHGLARGARRRRARQHAVLGREPAAAGAAQPAGHAVAERGRAEDVRVAQLDARRAGGELGHRRRDGHRPELVGLASCSQGRPPRRRGGRRPRQAAGRVEVRTARGDGAPRRTAPGRA